MESMMVLIPLFFAVALIYSSVGFGGGSSYLAVMAMFSFPYLLMPKVALLCNIIVVSGGCYIHYRSGSLNLKRAIPFAAGSVPLAYLGGKILINQELFLFFLAISLIVASVNMLFFDKKRINRLKQEFLKKVSESKQTQIQLVKSRLFELLAGSLLGFISGLVGIGGGIFLAPLLYLTRWGMAKQIAATASFFILINSISGLIGQFTKGNLYDSNFLEVIPLLVAVFLGGQIGSRLGAFKLSELIIKRTTACLIFLVGFRILLRLV